MPAQQGMEPADQEKDLPDVPGSLAPHSAPDLGPVGEDPDNIYPNGGKQ